MGAETVVADECHLGIAANTFVHATEVIKCRYLLKTACCKGNFDDQK